MFFNHRMLMKVRKDTFLQYCTWPSPKPTPPPLKKNELKNSQNRDRRKAIQNIFGHWPNKICTMSFFEDYNLHRFVDQKGRQFLIKLLWIILNFVEKTGFFSAICDGDSFSHQMFVIQCSPKTEVHWKSQQNEIVLTRVFHVKNRFQWHFRE